LPSPNEYEKGKDKVKQINWRSVGAAIAAGLTMLAALPYQLGDLATVIPPAWKAKVVVVGLVASVGLRLWNSIQPPKPPVQPQPTNP